jgi:hypothetical protein
MISRRFRRGLIFGLGVFFSYLVFCQFFFVTHSMSGIFRPLSSLVLIPAAQADGQRVSYRAVAELAHGMKGFGGATTNKEAFDRSLAVSVYRLYIEELAQELDVEVGKDEVTAYPVDLDVVNSGLEIAKWQEKDYRKYIVEPLLLAQKTEAAVSANDIYQADALEAMESLRKKVAQGMPFADVAQNFSQDPSALSRGDLGIMSMATLAAWLQPAVELVDEEIGTVSEILHAPDAYWSVTLVEYFPSEVPDQAAIHFRGIAVKKKSFGAVVGDSMADNPPWVFVW